MAAAQHDQHANIGNHVQVAAQPALGPPGGLAPGQTNHAQAHAGMHGAFFPENQNHPVLQAVGADLVAAHNQGGGNINLADIPNGAVVLNALLNMNAASNLSDAASRLLHAAERGLTSVVRELIESGLTPAELNSRVSPGAETALLMASTMGHAGVVALLIEAGACVECAVTGNRVRPIHNAVSYGHLPVVKLLVEQGHVDLTATCTESHNTVLHIAALNGQCAVLEYLLFTLHCDLCVMTSYGKSALDLAVREGFVDAAEIIVRYIQQHMVPAACVWPTGPLGDRAELLVRQAMHTAVCCTKPALKRCRIAMLTLLMRLGGPSLPHMVYYRRAREQDAEEQYVKAMRQAWQESTAQRPLDTAWAALRAAEQQQRAESEALQGKVQHMIIAAAGLMKDAQKQKQELQRQRQELQRQQAGTCVDLPAVLAGAAACENGFRAARGTDAAQLPLDVQQRQAAPAAPKLGLLPTVSQATLDYAQRAGVVLQEGAGDGEPWLLLAYEGLRKDLLVLRQDLQDVAQDFTSITNGMQLLDSALHMANMNVQLLAHHHISTSVQDLAHNIGISVQDLVRNISMNVQLLEQRIANMNEQDLVQNITSMDTQDRAQNVTSRDEQVMAQNMNSRDELRKTRRKKNKEKKKRRKKDSKRRSRTEAVDSQCVADPAAAAERAASGGVPQQTMPAVAPRKRKKKHQQNYQEGAAAAAANGAVSCSVPQQTLPHSVSRKRKKKQHTSQEVATAPATAAAATSRGVPGTIVPQQMASSSGMHSHKKRRHT